MPIIKLQRQMRELGRIRTGNQVAAGGGRTRPNKLDTFRITSDRRELVAAAAAAYGGTVVPWSNHGHAEFEVIITKAAIDIVVPPGQPVTQWMEFWSGGGCLRRCDSVTNVLDMTPCGSAPTEAGGGKMIPPCPLEVDERVAQAKKGLACNATTRLNVILPELPDLGVWRLESHGYYAAVELAGAAEILAMASGTGRLIPARLRLDQREKQIPGKPTNKYAVPVIEFVDTNFGALGITTLLPGGPAALGPGQYASAQIGPGAGAPVGGRPALPSTTLPPTSDFRAPTPPPPPPLTGEVLDRDDPEAHAGDAAPATLTHEALIAALKAADINQDHALARSKELFPRDPGVPLNDEQRAALLADLTAAAAAL